MRWRCRALSLTLVKHWLTVRIKVASVASKVPLWSKHRLGRIPWLSRARAVKWTLKKQPTLTESRLRSRYSLTSMSKGSNSKWLRVSRRSTNLVMRFRLRSLRTLQLKIVISILAKGLPLSMAHKYQRMLIARRTSRWRPTRQTSPKYYHRPNRELSIVGSCQMIELNHQRSTLIRG